MKTLKIIIVLLNVVFACTITYAQRTISLRDFETLKTNYRNHPDPEAANLGDGEDVTYIKDVNNELDQFVGTWKGTYNSRSYEFAFVKRISYKLFTTDEFTVDLLKGWVTVKDSIGNVIYTNTSQTENANGFTGANFPDHSNTYRLNFTGNCYNESGNVFIRVRANGQLSLTFAIMFDLKSKDCPNGFTPILPVLPNSVLLTKQP